MNLKLETERLEIKPVSLDDKEKIFRYRRDKTTNKFQGWIPETIEDVENFITKTSSAINEPETWFQFVIIEKQSQKIIGDIGVHFFDKENKQSEIGYTLDKEFQNQGYATESVKRVIGYLFEELHKHRIIASTDPANLKSIKLLERLGFRKEAHFVESLYLNGRWVDDLIFAMTDKDWKN